MSFYLSKLVYIFLKPVVWCCVSFLIALLFRKKQIFKKIILIPCLLMVVFSNPLLFNTVAGWWEGGKLPINDIGVDYDYVILLGGFSDYLPALEGQYLLNTRGNRLVASLELYRAGKAPKILISGGSGDIWEKRPSEAMQVKAFLLRMGLPEGDILVEPNSRNTYENALFTKKLLAASQPDAKCLLVTSAFHMPRAMRLFKKQGVDATPYATDFMARPPNRPDNIIVPSAQTLWYWDVLIKEWVGMVVYWMKGDL